MAMILEKAEPDIGSLFRNHTNFNAANSVRAEPVEALSFFFEFRKAGRPFDKLRADGLGARNDIFTPL
jgi:hypothetical protein